MSPGYRLAGRLGLLSLRGRYLYIAGILAMLLMASAWFSQQIVSTSTNTSNDRITERHNVGGQLRHLEYDISRAQILMQDYLIVPSEQKREELIATRQHLIGDADILAGTPWVQNSPERHQAMQQIHALFVQLRDEIGAVAAVRLDAGKLFPAMPIVTERMSPRDVDFLTQASFAIEAAAASQQDPASLQAYRLFGDARHAWSMMTRAFRMYVANRFRIFPGTPEGNMDANVSQVAFYGEMLERYLNRIEAMDRDGMLAFEQQNSIEIMRNASREWHKAFREVRAIYESDHWRVDEPLLHEKIYPHYAEVRDILASIRQDLEAESAADVSGLSGTTGHLRNAIWLISGLSFTLLLAGYLVFEYGIRRPVAQVTRALHAEARGDGEVVLPQEVSKETRELTEAFDLMRQQVRARQQRLETILDNAAEGIITFDHAGVIRSYNNAAEKLFGYDEAEILGHDLSLLVPPVDARDRREGYLEHFMRGTVQRLIGHEGEVIGRQKDGTRFPLALKVSEIVLQGEPLYTALVADITERKAMMEHLKDMAEHDGLTGLYNRSYFHEELERVVGRARRREQSYALLYIDLDNFKYINDTLGHAAGDKLLVEVASILNKRARKSDLIARLGGDEFIVLLYNIRPEQVGAVAESFRASLADFPFRHGSQQVDIGCSIGASLIVAGVESSAQVLSRADLACHLAKRGGRNRIHVFAAEDENRMEAMSLDMGWSRRIREAIEHNRFALACQPIVNLRTGGIESFEVLIRMLDENNALILPGGFLPSAERFGLIADIDRWVIVNAINTLAQQRRELPGLRYSLNLSGQTLTQTGIVDLIQDRLKATGLEPSALTFEVTETVAIADMAVAETFLGRLQQIGCQTALDDFGSGMSSFAYLKDLPVDCVKIDGRFVKNIAANSVDQAMVKAMNEIAHALGKRTIAEFVENEASLKMLKDFGLDYAQGYYLGRPDVVLPCKAIAGHADGNVICLAPQRRSAGG